MSTNTGVGVSAVKTASSSWTQLCKPTNVTLTEITGGIRIDFTPCLNAETEIYVSIDGGAYSLITTTGLTIGTYDYTCPDGFSYDFKLRSKYDVTVLNAPNSLAVAEITGGVRITWDDNNTEAEQIEIYADINSAGFVLLATVNDGVETYDHTGLFPLTNVIYKLRAKEGTLPVYSAYSSTIEITTSLVTPATITDTNKSIAWYEPAAVDGRLETAGVERVYWDMLYGNNTLGAEQNSGAIVLFAVYKITATQANFFYAGCAIGDTFVCGTVKTCDANNKVQRYTGNHLAQHTDSKRPTNGIFDGVDNFMKTAPFTWNQPTMIYIVFKQVSWTSGDIIFDGNTGDTFEVLQAVGTPKLRGYGGAYFATDTGSQAAVDSFVVLRMKMKSGAAASKLQINANSAITGTMTTNAGGFTLGSNAVGNGNWSNIEFKEAILRKVDDSAEDEAAIYDYLRLKYSIV